MVVPNPRIFSKLVSNPSLIIGDINDKNDEIQREDCVYYPF